MSIDSMEVRAHELFNELSGLIATLYPDQLDWFIPGISEHEVALAEQRLGIALPPPHRAALRFFNGFQDTFGGLDVFIEGVQPVGLDHLLPVQSWRDDDDFNRELLEVWRPDFRARRCVKIGPVKADPWLEKRILIGTGTSMVAWFIDFDPEPIGTSGQIIVIAVEEGAHQIAVVAPDFLAFMQVLIDSVKETLAEP